jgi:uncharacterized membrane protein YkoI
MLILALAGSSLILTGCGKSSANDKKDAVSPIGPTATIHPPDTSFAQGLGITGGPITSDQARSIAEAATSGVASKVEQEDEDGVQVFGVAVQAPTGSLDVKVRISDGAVTKIESDGGDAEGGGEAESGKD